MFPIRDDNPNVLVPYVTYGIIVVNAIAWVLVQGMGSDPMLSRSVCQLGLIPGALLGTVPAGTEFQINRIGFCVIGNASVWYTPLTSMFLHGGWLHVIGNMWFMWVFGDNVEDSMGHVRFVVFYLLCGLAAAAVQMATNPASAVPMVGASGAIGGVMGAYILYISQGARAHADLFRFLYYPDGRTRRLDARLLVSDPGHRWTGNARCARWWRRVLGACRRIRWRCTVGVAVSRSEAVGAAPVPRLAPAAFTDTKLAQDPALRKPLTLRGAPPLAGSGVTAGALSE